MHSILHIASWIRVRDAEQCAAVGASHTYIATDDRGDRVAELLASVDAFATENRLWQVSRTRSSLPWVAIRSYLSRQRRTHGPRDDIHL